MAKASYCSEINLACIPSSVKEITVRRFLSLQPSALAQRVAIGCTKQRCVQLLTTGTDPIRRFAFRGLSDGGYRSRISGSSMPFVSFGRYSAYKSGPRRVASRPCRMKPYPWVVITTSKGFVTTVHNSWAKLVESQMTVSRKIRREPFGSRLDTRRDERKTQPVGS